MRYTIEFTDTAKGDLRNTAIYITEQAKDKDIAKKLVKELTDQCGRLEEFSLIGAIPNDRLLTNLGYRFLVYGDYLIFYSIDDAQSKIYIQAIFNAKKDYTRFLKKI